MFVVNRITIFLKLFKKHIALISLLVLSIPSLIQIVHLFEDHEHFVCTSDTEQHYHENIDLDCCQFHYQLEFYSTEIATNFDVIPVHFYKDIYNEQPQITFVVHYSKKTPRGPPHA